MNGRSWATQLIETDRLPLKRSGPILRRVFARLLSQDLV